MFNFNKALIAAMLIITASFNINLFAQDQGTCGDGWLDEGEACDLGERNGMDCVANMAGPKLTTKQTGILYNDDCDGDGPLTVGKDPVNSDGRHDYGCDKDCKVNTKQHWECNDASGDSVSDWASFNKTRKEMDDLFVKLAKQLKNSGSDSPSPFQENNCDKCRGDTTRVELYCTQFETDLDLFLSMNKHAEVTCLNGVMPLKNLGMDINDYQFFTSAVVEDGVCSEYTRLENGTRDNNIEKCN